MSRSVRCPQCGLTQMAASRCKVCGSALPGEHEAAALLPESPVTTAVSVPVSAPALSGERDWLRRPLAGAAWFCIFFLCACVLVGIVAGVAAGMRNPGRAVFAGALAGRTAVVNLSLYAALVCAGLATWGAWMRFLPGTRTTSLPLSGPAPLRAGRALMIVGVFLGVQVLVAFLIGITMRAGASGAMSAGGRASVIILAQIGGVVMGGLAAFWLAKRTLPDASGDTSLASLGWSIGPRGQILVATLVGFLLAMSYLAIAAQYFPPKPDQLGGSLARVARLPGWPRHAWAVLALLLAPPIEEFLFRGVLFTGLRRSRGPVLAAMVVTALFVVLHLTEALTYWPALIAISLVAAGTMAFRIAAKSLGPAMALHAAYNLGIVLCVYSSVG